MKKLLSWLFVLTILTTLFMPFSVAETVYQTYGNGSSSTTTVFYVKSNGDSSIVLKQKYGQIQGSFSVRAWAGWDYEYGHYHINVYYGTSDSCNSYEWSSRKSGETYKLTFPFEGTYRVEITPYSLKELETVMDAWFLVWWTELPTWWVESQKNCFVSNTSLGSNQPVDPPHRDVTARITIEGVDKETNAVLYREYQDVGPGNTTINARTLDGYRIRGSRAANVFVNNDGEAMQSFFQFFYVADRPQEDDEPVAPPAVIDPPASSGSSGTWDTFFRPENTTTDNRNKYQQLDRLHDGDRSTVFKYLIWTPEWERRYDTPQFTVHYNNASISSISLINGDVGSSSKYYNNARVRVLQVEVYSSSGMQQFIFNVPDAYSTNYQTFSFGYTITGVYKVDVHITGTHDGTVERNLICIADMRID